MLFCFSFSFKKSKSMKSENKCTQTDGCEILMNSHNNPCYQIDIAI